MGTDNLSTSARLNGRLSGVGGLSGNMSAPSGGDYNRLVNRPSINNVELLGNKTSQDLGLPIIYYGTTEEWNSRIDIVSERQAIYIYTDHRIESDVALPAIKVGDGNSYLIDLPFVTADMPGVEHLVETHIADSSIHVSPEDRSFWNSKHKALVDTNETLVFTDL